jgi:hypothetical protein
VAYDASEEEIEAEVCEARTFLWDPLRSVCFHFGIAQRKLSSYAKEVMGISAPELVDRVKAESVRGKMKAALKEFVLQHFNTKTRRHEDTEGGKGLGSRVQGIANSTEETAGVGGEGDEDEVQEVWAALVKSRRAPKFHRTTWAMEFGFSSYPKFFRACLLCYGKTPHQIELEIIAELLEPQMDGMDEMDADGRNGRGCKVTEVETKESEVKTG